jgi:LysM repeat protein
MGTEDRLPPAPAVMEENPDAYASAHAIDDSARWMPVQSSADLQTAVAGGGTLGDNSVVESRMAAPNLDERDGVIESELRPGASVLAAGMVPGGGAVAPPRGADMIADPGTGFRSGGFVGPGGLSLVPPVGPVGGVAPDAGRGQTYVVQAGDTLTRIARKIYGPGKDRQYKRIFEANRDVLRSESDVLIGQELIIPPLPAPASASPPVDGASGRAGQGRYVTATMDDLPGTLARMGHRATPMAGRSYVVQRRDSLTGIARRLMHDDSPAAVRRLYEANRGVLDSPDRLKIGVELKLP